MAAMTNGKVKNHPGRSHDTGLAGVMCGGLR